MIFLYCVLVAFLRTVYSYSKPVPNGTVEGNRPSPPQKEKSNQREVFPRRGEQGLIGWKGESGTTQSVYPSKTPRLGLSNIYIKENDHATL